MPLKIFFVFSNAFSVNTNLVRLLLVLEADSSQETRAVFDERNRDAQTNKAYLFQLGWLLNIERLLAEGETLCIQFDKVGDDECVFYVDIEDTSGL